MGRLTWRDENGKAWFKPLDPDCGGCEFTDERCQHHVEISADRLAAYEETGLEPEEIKSPFTWVSIEKLYAQGAGISVDRLRDLIWAEKEGRLCILHKGEEGTCGGCGHFKRIPGTRRGTCEVRSYYTDSRGRIEANRGQFTPSQSRKCCKQYIPCEEAEAALPGSGGTE